MPSNDKLEDHVLYFESGMSVMEVANGLGVSVTELVKNCLYQWELWLVLPKR